MSTQHCVLAKPNGTLRLILEVSALNKFLVVKTFTIDTVNVIRRSVIEDSFGTSVDWSDAYHHVPVLSEICLTLKAFSVSSGSVLLLLGHLSICAFLWDSA